MDKDRLKFLTELLALFGAVFGLITSNLDNTLKFIVSAAVGVLIIVIVAFYVNNAIKANKSSSSRSVAYKTSKFFKYLLKIALVNEKKFKDFNMDNFNQVIDKKNRKIIKLSRNNGHQSQKETIKIEQLIEEKKAAVDKYFESSKDLTNVDGLKANYKVAAISKMGTYEQTVKEYDVIYKCINDMRRIMLDLDEYNKRIRLGKYVVNVSRNVDQVIDSYIDLLGWTYILIGEDMKGINAITHGIDLLDYQIEHAKSDEEKVHYLFRKARALRHIGTTYYTFSHKDKIDIEKYNADSLGIMESEFMYNYYHPTNCDEKLRIARLKEYKKMTYCIKYNQYVFDYYMLLNQREKSLDKYKDVFNKVDSLIKLILEGNKNGTFDDPHRLSKCLTLKNQIAMKMHTICGIKLEDELDFQKQISEDFKQIEGVFNKNIYFDEAMEVYVYQKIDNLYDLIENIYR